VITIPRPRLSKGWKRGIPSKSNSLFSPKSSERIKKRKLCEK
jgi:hypothetical protein